ncbi:MAG: glycosyltransferase 87 family protein [Bacteroidota bacterium]
MKLRTDKKLIGFTIFIVILCLLNLLINNINGKFSVPDFRVYYMAAQDFLTGGNVYFIAFGEASGFYKYSPLTLLFFIPSSFLPIKAAAILHLAILGFSFWYSFILVRKIFNTSFFMNMKKEGWLLTLAAISTMIFLVKELYLGNVNILLIMLLLLSLNFLLEGKDWKGALLLALVILTKPYYLLLIIPLLFRKRIKALIMLFAIIIAGLLIPALFTGFQRNLELHTEWFKTMIGHGADFPSLNSIDYLLRLYLFTGLPGYSEYLIIIAGALFCAVFVARNLRNTSHVDAFAFEWFIIMALLPSITKNDTEHFMASIPIITFIIYYISCYRKYWLIPFMFILVFFFGANSQDILGADLSKKLFYMGLIGLSNVLLIVFSFILFMDYRKKERSTNFLRGTS